MAAIFSKYVIVGLINTAVTMAVIFTLTYGGLSVYTANALGYIAGICVSFLLNVYFTFSSKATLIRLVKFLIVCGLSYLANLVAIKIVLEVNAGGIYAAQFLGMAIYTMIGFFLNKLWAMR